MLPFRKAYLSALGYTVIIGFVFIFIKIALKTSDPLNILAHRFTFSFLFLYALKKLGLLQITLTKKDYFRLFPLALFFPLLFFGFQHYSLLYITVSEGGIIQATVPLFTLLLATIFLKEYPTKGMFAFLCLSVFGVIYILIHSGAQTSASTLGIILMLLSTLANSAYNVLARKMTQTYSPINLTYAILTIGMLGFNLLSVLDYGHRGILKDYFLPLLTPSFLLSILYLSLLSSVVTAILSTYTLSQIEASKMSVFANLATLITIFSGILIFDESLNLYHLIGACFILVGVIGTNYCRR